MNQILQRKRDGHHVSRSEDLAVSADRALDFVGRAYVTQAHFAKGVATAKTQGASKVQVEGASAQMAMRDVLLFFILFIV